MESKEQPNLELRLTRSKSNQDKPVLNKEEEKKESISLKVEEVKV